MEIREGEKRVRNGCDVRGKIALRKRLWKTERQCTVKIIQEI